MNSEVRHTKFYFFSFLVIVVFLFNCCHRASRRIPGLCLSFDDRCIKEWYELSPLLDKYNAKVTFFVTQFDSLSPLEINLLKELQKKGHEIASHGAIHVNAEIYVKEKSYQEYLTSEIDPSIHSMSNAGFTPTSFAYPFGAKYWFTDMLLLKRFKILRGVSAIGNRRDISSIDDIYYCFDRNRTVSALGIDTNSGLNYKMVKKGIARACQQKEVLILYGHEPELTSNSHSYKFYIPFLEFILKEAKKSNLKFFTMSELAIVPSN